LVFDAIGAPTRAFWKQLGRVLTAISSLKDLSFGFDFNMGDEDYDEAPRAAYWFNNGRPQDLYLPLWKLFGNHSWPNLKKLRLQGLVVCEAGLLELCSRHKRTLQALDLHNIALWRGSFISLPPRLKDELSLDSFTVWGNLQSYHKAMEVWTVELQTPPDPHFTTAILQPSSTSVSIIPENWFGRVEDCRIRHWPEDGQFLFYTMSDTAEENIWAVG